MGLSPLRLAIVIGATWVAAGCAGRDARSAAVVRVDGSSTVFPISEAVAEEFQNANPDVRVTVGISGTGGGFQKFCRGEIDVSDASRPISKSEIEACRQNGVTFTELPIAYDGIAIVVNRRADWVDHITTAELRTLWSPAAQNTVMRWSQVRAGWPDREIRLFGAGVDSGTYDYFTEAVNGKTRASRGDFTSSEDDNVIVQGISNDELALGFLPYAYFAENASLLKLLPVDDGKAENGEGPLLPSIESIRTGIYQPLARPIFIYVAQRSAERPEVARFVDFYLEHGGALAQEVGYVDLGDQGYAMVREHFRERRAGSVFAGAPVGLTVEQLLAREREGIGQP